jgi:hypothetical protein
VSNRARMVMGSGAWGGRLVAEPPRHAAKAQAGRRSQPRIEFASFFAAVRRTPDRHERWRAIDLSVAVVESLARGVRAACRAPARLLAVLGTVPRSRGPEAPIRTLRRAKRGGP